MKKGTPTKAKKPRARGKPTYLILSERMGNGETLEELEGKARKILEAQPIVCQFCGGKGYIELDKVGLLVKPCYNCEKGKEQARAIGVPEDLIRIRTGANIVNSDSGTGQADNITGSTDTS